MRKGWSDFMRNKGSFLLLAAIFLGLQLLVAAAYLLCSGAAGTHTGTGIFVVFLLQQVFVYSRIVLRGVMYSTVQIIQHAKYV